MKKFCIIVDTSTNIKPNEFEDVFVVPMIITKNDGKIVKTLQDQIDITSNELLNNMINGEVYKTASPVMGECLSILEKTTQMYKTVFVISLPKTISGTFNQWKLLASEFDNVKVFDFPIVGDGCKEIIKDIFNMQEKTIDEIETYINDSHKKNAIGVILNETKYLVRGGRMSMLKSMIVSLLKFKLFIYLNENGLSLYGKSYKFSSLLSIVKDMFTETISANDKNVKVIYIFTSDASDIKFNNEKIVSALEKIFPSAQIKYSFLPSVIAAHVGPNYCAISAKVA